MKLLKISAGLLMLTGGVLFPQMVEAQLMRNLFTNPCCNVCGHQQCTCTTTRPVIETRMRQQQCLTYQDRKRISCKTEPVCETVPVTKELAEIILAGGNAMELSAMARKQGYDDLRRSALIKAGRGLTSLEEVNRVTKD